jgi:hypothetical protein
MGNHSCFHLFQFVVFRKIDMRLRDTNKSTAISSCIGEGHDSLVTPDAFFDWRLVDVKTLVLWSESKFVQSIRKIDTVKGTSKVFVFPELFKNGFCQFSQLPLELSMTNVLHESSMMCRGIVRLNFLSFNIVSLNFPQRYFFYHLPNTDHVFFASFFGKEVLDNYKTILTQVLFPPLDFSKGNTILLIKVIDILLFWFHFFRVCY